MASGSAVLASSGASLANLANLTSSLLKLPPSLQTYVDSTFDHLSGASDYLQSATGLSSTGLYRTVGAILLLGAIPTVALRSTQSRIFSAKGSAKKGRMSRYGWSTREELSPFNSGLGSQGSVPAVTDEDFSYITSEDLENHGLDIPRRFERDPHDNSRFARSAPGAGSAIDRIDDQKIEPDVLLIKHKGVTYPVHFPAYSIGDGKLMVSDLRDRVKLVMQLSESRAKRAKLLYKGRQLKHEDTPVREYGVKNNSEVMVVIGETTLESSEDSSEEIVIVSPGDDEEASKKKPRRRRRGKKREDGSPQDSGANIGLEVPLDSERRRATGSRAQSPSSAISAASSATGIPGGPIEKLNTIASHFTTKLLPSCLQFTASPPSDPKKRAEEHRKLSETVMQQVILKLDEVETSGEDGARARRKELVRRVQDVLKEMDEKMQS